MAGLQPESGLVARLIADVGDDPGRLTVLEHVLLKLWEHTSGFTNAAYEELEGLEGALRTHAEGVYLSFGSEKERDLVRDIFLRLTAVGGREGVVGRLPAVL